MRSAPASRRRAGTVLLALACGACFNPSGNDTTTAAATTDAASSGTTATTTDPSTSGMNVTSSSGVLTTGTTADPSTTTTGTTGEPTTTGSSSGSSTTMTDGVPVCGNGRTELGEGCDDGNINDGDGCDADCQAEATEPRFIFLTSQKYAATDLNGLAGAAERCKTLADSAEALAELHGRSWVAWLSDGNTDAIDQLGAFDGDYILPDEHVVVAQGADGLVSRALFAPIKENEKGAAEVSVVPCDQNPDDPVWTGTGTDGHAAFDKHCANWSVTNGEGLVGVYSALDANWTACVPAACNITARLYCVEI